MQNKLESKSVPFTGGCNTFVEPALLEAGRYSMLQNFRQMYPGLKKRAGQIKLHSTADSTNRVMSLFQFSKGKTTERHFYAQMSDGDVLEATTPPPGVTTGTFGSEVHDGTSSGMIPASWSVWNDVLFYSNGSDQHQIYYGQTGKIKKFIVYVSAAAIPTYPILGADYTDEVTDGLTNTVAVLDSLGDLAVDYDCVFICAPVPIKQLTWTLGATTKGNTTAAAAQMKYWKNDSSFAAVTAFNDGTELLTLDVAPATPWIAGDTITGQTSNKSALIVAVTTTTTYQISGRTGAFTLGEVLTNGTVTADQGAAHPQVATLGYSGNMTWTTPTDSAPSYMFGTYGYWYQYSLSSGDLDAEVEVSAVTFEANFSSLKNLWDGILVEGVEAQNYDNSASMYYTYSTDNIDLTLAFETADYLYVAFADPLEGLYFDVGESPSTVKSNTIDGLDYWNGTAWATVGSFTDNTIGLTQSGFIMMPRRAAGLEQKLCFNNTQYYAYWYRVSVNKALSAAVNIGVQGIPIFDIDEFGTKGLCCSPWKNRMVYTFNQSPQYIYISKEGDPQALSSDDSDIKLAGDGRGNKIVCMKPFYNELITFQEEKGVEGGCITIFDGYNPDTFGKLIISTKYGTMNAQSVSIVEGFTFGGQQQASLIAFFLSRNGVMYTEGKTVSLVPNFDEIRNYFDPTSSTCIRTGYESHMWLKHDSSCNILRIGLVTGSSATVCNTFLIYNLTDMSWGFDVYAQELASFTECEAASGSVPVLQIGGGVDDGFVYLCNSGLNDVTTAIDSYVLPEFDIGGDIIQIDEITLRAKAQTGNITVTPYLNSIAQTAMTLSQAAETATQTIRRNKKSVNLTSQHISLKIQHNTIDQSCLLEDMALKIRGITEQ